MKTKAVHPLESNAAEQQYFEKTLQGTARTAPAAYRRAVEACTGSLPTWAKRSKPGRKRRTSDPFRSMASGDYSR
jgi:hypothetical protein